MRLTPNKAVKAHCMECLGMDQFNRAEVEMCQGDTCLSGPCPFFLYRLGKRISVKVFRSFCKHCMGGQAHLIADCTSINCKVYPYRFGKNQARRGMEKNFYQVKRDGSKKDQESMIKGKDISQCEEQTLNVF